MKITAQASALLFPRGHNFLARKLQFAVQAHLLIGKAAIAVKQAMIESARKAQNEHHNQHQNQELHRSELRRIIQQGSDRITDNIPVEHPDQRDRDDAEGEIHPTLPAV